ncbi:MAG: hypothetical protein WBD63_07740 [Phycisphaerae bacterium]|nr:hypothetical protein [Phycisphaerae bacterium]
MPPESVTTVGDNIKVVSKTFTPPGDMAFKEFPSPNPWQYVDIETDPDTLTADVEEEGPDAIQISAAEVEADTAGDWPLKGEGNLQPPPGGEGPLPSWSAMISKVELYWETYDLPGDNEAIDDHPAVPANGGRRIFPGKKEYDDSVEDAAKRRLAFAVLEFAEGGAPTAGTEIYFRLWDVDDPSADGPPIDTEPEVDPGTSGPDNRDASACFAAEHVQIGKVKRFDGTTACEAYKAKMTIRAGMQPGDNWRFAVAWGDGAQARLQAMTQPQADTCQPPDGVAESEMLTTWRKVHVEFDTMEAPDSEPFGTVTGNSSKITNDSLQAQGEPNWVATKLEGGVLDPDQDNPNNSVDFVGDNTWEVLSNTEDTVTVLTNYTDDDFDNDEQNGRDDAGEVFTMSTYAADPSNDPFGINTDDPEWRTDLNPPNAAAALAEMNLYFDDAYILCVEQTTGNAHSEFGWVRMTNDNLAVADVPGDTSYWTVCVGWAYESAAAKLRRAACNPCADHTFYWGDDDPESEGFPPGHVTGVHGNSGAIPSEQCTIFLEMVRDHELRTRAHVVCHEVGHCFGLDHADYEGEFDPDKDGIMEWKQPESITCEKQWFDMKNFRTPAMPDRFSYQNIADLREAADD